MVQDDSVIANSMQGYSLAHGSVQWSCGVFPPGRPPDRVLEHTIELRLPRINEWMGEPQGAAYPSMIDLHLGYHQMRAREQDSHRSASRLHYDFLVMPLGLTNTLVTFQSCRQWQRHLLLLFDALIIYNRTWEVHLSQLGETGEIMAMTEFFHLDLVISAQGAQEEIQALLDRFTEGSTTVIGSGDLPIWWWDPGIHPNNGLLQMRMVTDRVEAVIGLRHCGDVVRGVVEFFSIWRDSFSLTIPRIEYSHGLAGSDFTKMPRLSMIHDSGYPGTAVFPEFTLGMLRIGCSEEWSSEELIEFTQLMIAWLTRGSQVDSCISTLQISAMSRECFTSSRQARERFAWRGFMDDVGGDMGECTTCQQSRSGHTHPTGLMQSLAISGREWESMLTDCITGLPRVQWEDSMYATIDQFTHFPVISSEYGATQVTELSSGEMFRVHEQLRVIASDRDKLPFPIFEIEYGSGFAGRDFTWMPMQATIHGSRFNPYRYFSLEFQERRMQTGHDIGRL
jgi:hypothetical protein